MLSGTVGVLQQAVCGEEQPSHTPSLRCLFQKTSHACLLVARCPNGTVVVGVIVHPLDRLSKLDNSMQFKRAPTTVSGSYLSTGYFQRHLAFFSTESLFLCGGIELWKSVLGVCENPDGDGALCLERVRDS